LVCLGVPERDLEQVSLGWRKPHIDVEGTIVAGDTPGGQVSNG